ncbi:MAG: sigma-70 family RNA polymerase sigma factor [Verrucomicrobia bacterium]|nr:sigma-70 family RNA polymerase sigma factor [Verrucomicrobiota bacterium]
MNAPGEADLLRRCRRGDENAWNELFDRHYAAAARFVQQVSPSLAREDVEEICQETFLTIVKNIFSFQEQCRFQTWLFRIAANKARDHIERQHAAKRGGGQLPVSLQAEDANGLTLDPPSQAPGPDLALVSAENVALLNEALAHLGGPCQEVIELRYYADLSYDEIATVLELNPKTVSSRLSKCLDRLEVVARRIFSREKNTPVSV